MPPFLRAATLGSLSSVQRFLDSGLDANIRYRASEVSALDVGVLMGHREVVRTLLAYEYEYTTHEHPPLRQLFNIRWGHLRRAQGGRG